VGLLIFPSSDLIALGGELLDGETWTDFGKRPAVRQTILAALQEMAHDAGSSQCAKRVLILDTPPSIDSGEITDKGYINQAKVLAERDHKVTQLFSDDACVIEL
jgi:feruloyl-CoA synthase